MFICFYVMICNLLVTTEGVANKYPIHYIPKYAKPPFIVRFLAPS